MEVLFGDSVVLLQASFCLIPEVLDAVDVVLAFTVINAFVIEF